MKRVITILLGVLLVVSPTIALAGLYFYFQSSDSAIVNTELVTGEITDMSGNKTVCASGDTLMTLFVNMHGTEEKKPTAVNQLPADIAGSKAYEAVYKDKFDMEYAYKYYLNEDPEKCYFVDNKSRTYQVDKTVAEAFLNSDYAEQVYLMSNPPKVSLGDAVLTPYTIDWSYKTVGGILKGASCSYKDKDEKTTLTSFVSSFSPTFSVEPDTVSVTVKNTGTGAVIYTGNIEGMKDITVEGSFEASVDMTVVWKNGENKSCAGSAQYFFGGRMFGKAVFQLNTNHAVCGDVVILTAYNVSSPDEIEIESIPELTYQPDFYKVGDTWQALIPLAYNAVSEKTDFFITVSSTASHATDVMSLQVEPLVTGEFKSYSTTSIKNLYSESTLQAFKDNLLPIAKQRSSFSFAGGKFVVPTLNNYVSGNKVLVYSFGTKVIFVDTPISYTALEQAYWAHNGPQDASGEYGPGVKTEVLAAFDGKVVYVGSQSLTGRVVAIDHGSGLITWYTNLTSTAEKPIEVKVGDTVKAGQRIAYAADGGINENQFNFHFRVAATVNGVPVNVQSLIDSGLFATSSEQ